MLVLLVELAATVVTRPSTDTLQSAVAVEAVAAHEQVSLADAVAVVLAQTMAPTESHLPPEAQALRVVAAELVAQSLQALAVAVWPPRTASLTLALSQETAAQD